jgi:hypothetical protein
MGGTGLALALVKHILNRHRGFLEIDSTPGVGSVFTVFLRIHPTAGRPAAIGRSSERASLTDCGTICLGYTSGTYGEVGWIPVRDRR